MRLGKIKSKYHADLPNHKTCPRGDEIQVIGQWINDPLSIFFDILFKIRYHQIALLFTT
jgi:hypothetical protein